MSKHFILLTVVSLFVTSLGMASTDFGSDDPKVREILDGTRVNCSGYEPNINPTLNFETASPMVIVNETQSQVSLQMKVVYYRCIKADDGETSFKIADPSEPYQYEVEQFDGSKTLIKVNGQQFRFSAMLDNPMSTDVKSGIPARNDKAGMVNNIRFDLPLGKILNASQRQSLKSGKEVSLVIKMIGALSTDFKIGDQTQGSSGFTPTTSFSWELKLSEVKKGLKVELVRVKSNSL